MTEVEKRLKKEIEMCQDFESYNDEVLKYHDVMICERDSCETGLKRALEIVKEYKNEGVYKFPVQCEVCGSEDLVLNVKFYCNQVRWRCNDCGENKALIKLDNLRKRTNSRLNNVIRRTKTKEGRCRICGASENLVAHHIIPVSHAEEYKYMESNLITLCKKCHYLVHYQRKGNFE